MHVPRQDVRLRAERQLHLQRQEAAGPVQRRPDMELLRAARRRRPVGDEPPVYARDLGLPGRGLGLQAADPGQPGRGTGREHELAGVPWVLERRRRRLGGSQRCP